ncbi:MAG: hypothetical protein M3P50_09920 [Actinomycetota bacterium]|nr:hypothetical protein [Actinomycetota bacterium]
MALKDRERIYVEAVEEVQHLDEAEAAVHKGDTEEAAKALAEAKRRRLRAAPPIPVSVAAKLLKVSEPTIRSWLDTGVLEDAGTKPRAVRIESVVRTHRLLGELRERGQDRNVRQALLAHLDDELALQDERLQSSIASMRRGRGGRPVVAGPEH